MNSCLWSATEDEIGNYNSRVSYCIWVIRNMDFDIDFFFFITTFYCLRQYHCDLWFEIHNHSKCRDQKEPEATRRLRSAPSSSPGKVQPAHCVTTVAVLPSIANTQISNPRPLGLWFGNWWLARGEHLRAEGMLPDVSITWDILGKISKNLFSCTSFPFVECSLYPITALLSPPLF